MVAHIKSNQFLINLKGPQWTRNMANNRAVYFSERGRDLKTIFGTRADKPVLLLGPGPSLDMVTPLMPLLPGEFTVIACNSSLNPLAARGIVPDFVVVLDAEPKIAEQIAEFVAFVPEESRKGMTMIAAATVCPKVIKKWPGKVVFFGHAESGTPESKTFYDTLARSWEDPENEDESKRAVTMLGTVACVFNTMIAISTLLEAKTIWLAGFELPIEIGSSYLATRYDLSTNPPKPVTSQENDVDFRATQRHRGYLGAFLLIVQSYVHGKRLVINLSPLASFRDLVMTQNPQSIVTGQVRVHEEAVANGSG